MKISPDYQRKTNVIKKSGVYLIFIINNKELT
jgi:hypothetical protein